MYVRTYIHTYMCTYVRTYVCMYVCMYVWRAGFWGVPGNVPTAVGNRGGLGTEWSLCLLVVTIAAGAGGMDGCSWPTVGWGVPRRLGAGRFRCGCSGWRWSGRGVPFIATGLVFVGACPDWSTCSQIPVRMLAVFASVWAAVNVSCLNGNILCEVRAQKIN